MTETACDPQTGALDLVFSKHRQGNTLLQQNLKAWNPHFSPRWVMGGFSFFGVAFLAFGVVLWTEDNRFNEISYDYTSTMQGQFSVSLRIDEDMKAPSYFYYELENFHQNHRRYTKSFSKAQLFIADLKYISDLWNIEYDCDPWTTDSEGRMYFPCGLLARSVFNDSFILDIRSRNSKTYRKLNIDQRASTIAWRKDSHREFQNLNPEGSNIHKNDTLENEFNMWLNSYYPPEICEPAKAFQNPKDYRTIYLATKGKHNVTDCKHYMSRSPRCEFTLTPSSKGAVNDKFPCNKGYHRKPNPAGWGVANAHFIIWMRPAALPNFRKLYAEVTEDIFAGDTIRITVFNHFPVRQFKGRKLFVLTSNKWASGKLCFLGIAYIIGGILFLLYSLIYGIRHLVSKRTYNASNYYDWY